MVIRVDRGEQQARITMKLKAENGSNGLIARSAIQLKQSTSGPSGSTSTDMLIVDNGTAVFTIDAKKKEYWQQPHGGDRIRACFGG